MIDSAVYLAHLRRVLARNRMDQEVDAVLPTQLEISLRGLRLHYHDWGNGKARPLLFLHGGGLTSHTWDAICLGLRNRYHFLALDFRGHGDSQWAENYEIDSHVEDVRAIVDALSLRDLGLIGMSLGGIVAVTYAGRFSDLSELVVIDIGPSATRGGGSQRIRDFIDGAELDSIDNFVERSLKFNPKRDRELLRASLLHNLRELPNGKWTWKYDKRHYMGPGDQKLFVTALNATWAKVPDIKCRTLVVRGADSDILSETGGKQLAETFPHGTYVEVPRAGHTVQGDNPAGLVAALRRFLA